MAQERRGYRRFARLAVAGSLPIVLGAVLWSVQVRQGEGVQAVRTTAQGADSSSTSIPPTTSAPTGDPPPSSPEAMPLCQARLAQRAGAANPWRVSLVAAYASTAGDVAAHDEGRRGPGFRSRWRDRPATEFAAVCWFDADAFGATTRHDLEHGDDGSLPDRLEEIVRPDGVPVQYAAGRKSTLHPAPIRAGGAR